MNNVLQGMHRGNFKGLAPEPQTELATAVEARKNQVISDALNEWNGLLESVKKHYQDDNSDCLNSVFFVHVWIPTIITTKRTNSKYAGERWTRYINETISELNVKMTMAAGVAMAPSPIDVILTDVLVEHVSSPADDKTKIDDGVHFLDSSYKNLADGISKAINNHKWQGCSE